MSGDFACAVWWKRQDEWVMLYKAFDLGDALRYARDNIVHGGITQRIEIREKSGEAIRAVWDSAWTSL